MRPCAVLEPFQRWWHCQSQALGFARLGCPWWDRPKAGLSGALAPSTGNVGGSGIWAHSLWAALGQRHLGGLSCLLPTQLSWGLSGKHRKFLCFLQVKLYKGDPRRWGRFIFLSHLSPPLPAELFPKLRHPRVAEHSCFSLSAAPTAECLKISFPHFYFTFCPGGDSKLSPCARRPGISSLSPTQEWDTAGTRPCPCTGTLFHSCWGDTKVTFQEVTQPWMNGSLENSLVSDAGRPAD